MSIIRFQYISPFDKLAHFKESILMKHPNCSIYNHEPNANILVSTGTYEGKTVTEKIITDGTLELQKINPDIPMVVWHNQLLPLQNGKSIEVQISKAQFMIVTIKYDNQIHHEIHTTLEEPESLTEIINLIYRQAQKQETTSVAFKDRDSVLLDYQYHKNSRQEVINLKTGNSRTKIKH